VAGSLSRTRGAHHEADRFCCHRSLAGGDGVQGLNHPRLIARSPCCCPRRCSHCIQAQHLAHRGLHWPVTAPQKAHQGLPAGIGGPSLLCCLLLGCWRCWSCCRIRLRRGAASGCGGGPALGQAPPNCARSMRALQAHMNCCGIIRCCYQASLAAQPALPAPQQPQRCAPFCAAAAAGASACWPPSACCRHILDNCQSCAC
jgi:hypothetical protein